MYFGALDINAREFSPILTVKVKTKLILYIDTRSLSKSFKQIDWISTI